MDNLLFANQFEAQAILNSMLDLMSKFDVVSVNDVYSLVDAPATFTDDAQGWTDISTAYIKRVGLIDNTEKKIIYALVLPEPKAI